LSAAKINIAKPTSKCCENNIFYNLCKTDGEEVARQEIIAFARKK
jgi:hypothetical protein